MHTQQESGSEVMANKAVRRCIVETTLVKFSILLGCLSLWAFTIYINWPGHYSFDSIVQLAEGMTGYYVSPHSPLMSQILGGVTRIGGHGLFIAINSFLFFLAQFFILSKFKNLGFRLLLMLVLVAVVSLNPMVLIYNGTVWKDVFCANLLLLSFVTIWFFKDTHRLLGVTIGLGLAVIASMVRQQGALVAIVIMLYTAWAVRKPGITTRIMFFRSILVYSFSMILLFSAIHSVVKFRQEEVVQGIMATGLMSAAAFDVAGMIVNSDSSKAVLSLYISNSTEALKLARQFYTPARIDTLSPFLASISHLSEKELLDLWFDLALHQPSSLFKHKANAALALFSRNESVHCLPVHIGVVGNALDFLQQAGYPYHFPQGFLPNQSDFLEILFLYSESMPYIFTGWFWLALLALFFFLGFRRKICFIHALAIGGLVYVGSFVVVGLACDFRYQYFGVVAAMSGALILVGQSLNRLHLEDQ